MEPEDLLDGNGEVVVVLADGCTLRSGGTQFLSGEYVRLCEPDGREYMYWDQEEWRTDPALVMGAILNAAAGLRLQVTDSPVSGRQPSSEGFPG